jgi:hypothetical protein
LDVKEAAEAQATYSEQVGRTVMLSTEALNRMGELGKITGLGTQGVSEMAGQMEAFGFGTTVAMEKIGEIRDTAQGMGINTGKVLKKVQQNANLLNKLNFKGGINGLGKMAAYSEKFKMDMGAVAESAKAVWSPEGAIEASASLQTLGGGFSKLADPFKLMFDARNDPEKYAESITKSLDGIAKFSNGEFIVSAYEMQRLEEAGKALGFSGEQMAEMAKQQAKMKKMGGLLSGMTFENPDDRKMLEGMIEFDKKGNALIGDKQLKDLKKEEIDALIQREKTSAEEAKNAMSTREMFTALSNQLMSTLLPIMEALDPILRSIVSTLGTFIKDNPILSALTVGLGIVIGKVAEWYMKGYHLGLGFNAATGGKGFLGSLKGVFGKLFGKSGAVGAGAGVADMVTSKSGKAYAADSPQGKMIRTKGGTSPLGEQSDIMKKGGMNASSMLKGAAAVLVLSAALFVFAKALQEFDKLEGGWGTLVTASASLLILSGGLFLVGKIMDKATGSIIKGSLAILILGAALIPFAYAMSLLSDVGVGTMLGAALALGAFALVAGIMGAAIVPILLGSVAILALSGALAVFGLAMGAAAPGFEMFINAFSNLPQLIGPMLLLGPALLLSSLGVLALSASLIALGLGWALGGWAFESLSTSLESISKIDAEGITKTIESINNVDLGKIEALKELSMAMSLWGLVGGKPIVVQMNVDGEIKMSGDDGKFSVSELSSSQISELKDLIFQKQKVDSSGGYT